MSRSSQVGSTWLIVWCSTMFSTVFQLYHGGQYTYPCLPGVLLTCATHSILSKLMAAFKHNHCRNNGQPWGRNESCRNDYHQSSERILAKPGIKPVLESCILPTKLWSSTKTRNTVRKSYFYFRQYKSFKNTVGKGEIARNVTSNIPFPTVFSTG